MSWLIRYPTARTEKPPKSFPFYPWFPRSNRGEVEQAIHGARLHLNMCLCSFCSIWNAQNPYTGAIAALVISCIECPPCLYISNHVSCLGLNLQALSCQWRSGIRICQDRLDGILLSNSRAETCLEPTPVDLQFANNLAIWTKFSWLTHHAIDAQ